MKKEQASRSAAEETSTSQYTGGAVVRKLIGFVAFFVSLITLSIANPAMVCWKQRWECRHTYIDGKQLVFDGKAMQLFGKYIVWLLLSIVTIGIYLFWLSVKKKKWIIKHTHILTEETAYVSKKADKEKRLAAMTDEERAANDKKLFEKKKQAHLIGLLALVLICMPQFGIIFAIVGIVYGAVYREKFALRASTSVFCIIFAVVIIVIPSIILHVIPLVATVIIAIIVVASALTASFLVSKKWESVSIKGEKEEEDAPKKRE